MKKYKIEIWQCNICLTNTFVPIYPDDIREELILDCNCGGKLSFLSDCDTSKMQKRERDLLKYIVTKMMK